MKNRFALAIVAVLASTAAFASSPALILDAGTNPKYFAKNPTVNEAASSSPAIIRDAGTNPKYFASTVGNTEQFGPKGK